MSHAERDAADRRLLANGDYKRLLATYLPVIQTRVYARVYDASADDVVQNVLLRLYRELESGKTYPVPFRVVVHNVIGWEIQEHFRKQHSREVPLPDSYDAPGEPDIELDDDSGFFTLLEGLTDGQREVVVLRYHQGLEITEIARRCDKSRGAVDVTLHRALKVMRRRLLDVDRDG